MNLYHFCAARSLRSILESGLILGKTPVTETCADNSEEFILKRFLPDTQWLTLCDDFDAQSWATTEQLKYRRDDFRLTIEISQIQRRHLLTMDRFCKMHNLEPRLFLRWAGSHNWRVFMGRIPAAWVKQVIANPRLKAKGTAA